MLSTPSCQMVSRTPRRGTHRSKIEQAGALVTLKAALGDKVEAGEVFEAVAAYVAGCAATATNLRCFEPDAWATFASEEPFKQVIDQVRTKMEVAVKPKEEIEEEDIEGVDLCTESPWLTAPWRFFGMRRCT